MPANHPAILVVGPAYLDHVFRVDRPLVPPGLLPPGWRRRYVLDRSVGELGRDPEPADILVVRSTAGDEIRISGSGHASLPFTGTVLVEGPWVGAGPRVGPEDPRMAAVVAEHTKGPAFVVRNSVALVEYRRLLGGMGAGFAAALKAKLIAPLGSPDGAAADQVGESILGMLAEAGVSVMPQLLAGYASDTTLLLTSGRFGDKFPVGRRQVGRGFHVDESVASALGQAEIVVLAAVENDFARAVLDHLEDAFVVFAATFRHVMEKEPKLVSLAERIDYVCCNEQEWELLDGREELRRKVPLVTVTRGKRGAVAFFKDTAGEQHVMRFPAFGAGMPPVDTNRAGEAFAAAFLNCILAEVGVPGLRRRGYDPDLIAQAGKEAAVAAFLQVQTAAFRFAPRFEILRELRSARGQWP